MSSYGTRIVEQEMYALVEENKRLKEALAARVKEGNKPMACRFCRFFMQHYIKDGDRYTWTNSGHCKVGKSYKRRTADNNPCEFFEMIGEKQREE